MKVDLNTILFESVEGKYMYVTCIYIKRLLTDAPSTLRKLHILICPLFFLGIYAHNI